MRTPCGLRTVVTILEIFAELLNFATNIKSKDMSQVCLLTHIVITTYKREMTIGVEQSAAAYSYITGIINNHGCKLLSINGIPNHIHILIDLSPMVALSNLMMEIKRSSSIWMKECGCFPMFKKWSEGYYASSVSYSHKQNVINYINGQLKHHENMKFEDEYNRLVLKNGMTLYKFPD